MKKIIILFIFFASVVNAKNNTIVNYNGKIFEGEIIYSSTSCEIVKIIDDNNNPLFLVLASALEFVAIEYGRSVCVKVANPEICNAVADGVGLISGGFSIGKSISKIAMNGSLKYTGKHVAENGIGKRVLEYATEAFQIATDVKNVFEAYDKLKIIKWENLNYSEKLNTIKNNNGIKFYLKNNTYTNLLIEMSYDGLEWTSFKLNSGYSNNYTAHSGETIQSYGFIKINNCVFQLKTGYKYHISLDKYNNEYKITEK